ncbi:DinB family protein [Mycobacterium intracellulare]|uniref:DinB family protein n=1 Tax=Mycobacterium intracellulare TaxID=1767 RepID=UPI001CD9DC01|nr:DinB family protein [Mycobacterium intracellulare]MCA2247556.1 DinB family protein [Mycobacterium intracellulare]
MTSALDSGRPFTGTEREVLENTLDLNRSELIRAVDGLSEGQARQRRVPSLTTPLSLVKHCAAAERIWFQRTLAGMRLDECDGHASGGDGSFRVADEDTLAAAVTDYVAACQRSRDIAARYRLDDVAEHHLVGAVSLRFIYVGMIAEVARHAGHADILTEQIRAAASVIPDERIG